MNHYTKFWHLKDFNLFKKLGEKNLLSIMYSMQLINVRKGEILELVRSDKKVIYFIKSGSVKVITNQNNHTNAILNMGNLFGELKLYELDKEFDIQEIAIALEDSVLCVIEKKQMKMLLEKHASLKNQLLKIHGLRIRRLQRNLEDLLYKDSETRIKEYILQFVKEFGTIKENLVVAKNLLSHQDIANLTNTSRQTVSNVLSKLRKEKIIDYDAKFISFLITKKN